MPNSMERLVVRNSVETYFLQKADCANLSIDNRDENCQKVVELAVSMIVGANSGLQETIDNRLRNLRDAKYREHKKGWQTKIRLATQKYCEALNEEFDIAGLFDKSDTVTIDCLTALTNKDCFDRASEKARITSKQSSRLYGFFWFGSAA